MMDLKLNDLLHLSDEEIGRTKVRLNTWNGEKNPIDEFKKNPSSLLGWNYWNNQSYKEGQISIGLVNLHNDNWLLFTVGKITRVLDKPKDFHGIGVEFETLSQYEHLFGRAIIHYKN